MILFLLSLRPKVAPYTRSTTVCHGLFVLLFMGAVAVAGSSLQPFNTMREWPEAGPRLLWTTDLLESGASAPVVLDGVVYVTGGREEGSLFAFNMEGRLLWRRVYGAELDAGAHAGPRCAPVVERDVIIVASSLGNVHALRTDSQAGLWSFNVFVRYGGNRPAGGYGATPILHADLVILACGGNNGTAPSVVAVDRLTGDTAWVASSLPGDFMLGDGGPSMLRHPGGELVIAPFNRGLLALEPSSGRRAWGWSTAGGESTAHPVCGEGLVYIPSLGGRLAGAESSASSKGGVMLKVTEGGGYLELWRGPSAEPWQSAMVDGRLFVGDACYDAVLGRRLGKLDGLGGVMTSADGMLYYLQDGPVLSLVDPAGGAMRLGGRFRPEGIGDRDLCVPPVVGEGRIFLRDRSRMSVYDLRVPKESAWSRRAGSGIHPGTRPPVRWQPAQNLLWRRPLPVTGLSAPVVHRGKVFMAGEPGAVACCDAESGVLEWFRNLKPMAGRARNAASAAFEPIASGDRVWARFADGAVLCLGLDGTTIWSSALEPCSNAASLMVLSDGILILGGGDIVGLDAATGGEKWRLRAQGVDLDVTGSAWISDRGVVFSSAGHVVRSLDGTVIARDLPAAMAGRVAVDGLNLYTAVGDDGGSIIEAFRLPPLAERGLPVRSLWRTRAGGHAPVCLMAAGGRVLLTTDDGAMHVFDGTRGGLQSSRTGSVDRAGAEGGRLMWMVSDRVYLGNPGSTGAILVCSIATNEASWSFSTSEPFVGMAFDGGRQYVRAGSVLHCIGGVTPSRPAVPRVVDPVPDSWFRVRGRRPISRVTPGEMPRFWLYCGPFAWQRGRDPLGALGGAAAARPAPGEDAADGRRNRKFALLKDPAGTISIDDAAGACSLDLSRAAEGAALPCAYYLFTTIESPESRWLTYTTCVAGKGEGSDGALRISGWIGGKEVKPGDFVHLAAGRTALMVEVVMEAGVVAGRRLSVSPGFMEAERRAVESAIAADAAWKSGESAASLTFVVP